MWSDVPVSAARKVDELPRTGYTAKEFSLMINMPYSTVMARIAAGEIPAHKLGRFYVIPADYVEGFRKAPSQT